ncbi:hypothetical protein BHM03_00014890 [Ensete ventricosum]|nr:hypothetical protein BHM03_00014890 [Ensete ventricosum]
MTPSNSLASDKSNTATKRATTDDPLCRQSDQAPLGDVTKQPEPASSMSTRNFSDPDMLSSGSTGSLREQLRLYVTVETLVAEKREDQKRLRGSSRGRDHRRYCRFYRDYGHDTEECYDLKNQIEDLIHSGHLDRYIRKPLEPSLCLKGSVERHIDVIVGSPTMGGISSSARKAYARAEVQKRPWPRGDPGFTFDSESQYPDHDDALVVMAHIANAYVKGIMIDTRSFADILYIDAFHNLIMTNWDLAPMTSTLTGFTSDAITLVGVATLPVTFDDEPRT